MKKLLRVQTLLLFAISIVLTSACKKEDPAASTNVTARTFSVSSWTYNSPHYYATLSVPELTSANINSAAVMVYFGTSSGIWFAVPYTEYHYPSNYVMGFSTYDGHVELTWFYDSSLSAGDDPNTFYGTTIKCKVVVIPETERKANPDLDYKNYNAVKAAFHLKD